VAQNHTAARIQFEAAADKGLASAFNGLGVLAWNGQVGQALPVLPTGFRVALSESYV
jgi:hypothetical protein